MASEAVVSYVVGKLGDLVIEEARLLHEVQDEIEWIVRELKRMRLFLKDADAKQEQDERVRNWAAEIRDVAYDAEDVIDTFIISKIVKTAQRRRRRGISSSATRQIRNLIELKTHYKVGKKIQRIKLKINDISRSLSTYGIRDNNIDGQQETSLNNRRQFHALFEESEITGLQEDMKTLKEQLINGETRLRVIAIVGMAGSGKTTLAKRLYHDVKNAFECHAFICVTQQYRIGDVLVRIIECVMSLSLDSEKYNEQYLGKKLHDHLANKRYLILIDDIWSKEAWDTLKFILRDDLNKSRVLLTTRNKEVALHADPSHCLHEICLLNDDESWELFLKNIFPRGNTSVVCPSGFEETGRRILAKCHGLPLAIMILGGLLSIKDKTLTAWSKVLESVTWHLHEGEGSNQCMEILALSFFDLPHYLKPCFLYLGLFPEDFEIQSKELVKLWIAEGFIQQRGNEIMEDVAEDYMEELIGRSMILVARKRSNGSVSTCRTHDLLRDLSISQARRVNFFATRSDSEATSSSTSLRRLAFYRNVDQHETLNHSYATLRSMLYFSGSTIYLSKLLNRGRKGGKLLRVLHVDGVSLPGDTLPKEIGKEVHLRYLSLRNTRITSLPSSIGNLYNLQTLIITSLGDTLPNAIWNLEQLRHLYAYHWDIDGHPRLNNLRNLQTLCLRAGSWIKDGLDKLTNLRKLGINGDLSSNHKALSDAMEKLCNLQSLKLIDWKLVLPSMSFQHLLKLYKIYLQGRMERLPDFPPNLAKLTWHGSRLQQDDIEKLEKLPNILLRL